MPSVDKSVTKEVEKDSSKWTVSTILVRIAILLFVCLTIFTLTRAYAIYQRYQTSQVPEPVLSFLAMYTTKGVEVSGNEEMVDEIFDKYFYNYDIDSAGYYEDEYGNLLREDVEEHSKFFTQIYSYISETDGFEYEYVSPNFIKFWTLDYSGERNQCPIGFWFTIKHNQIDTWKLCRLIPFSVYDEERADENIIELWERG